MNKSKPVAEIVINRNTQYGFFIECATVNAHNSVRNTLPLYGGA